MGQRRCAVYETIFVGGMGLVMSVGYFTGQFSQFGQNLMVNVSIEGRGEDNMFVILQGRKRVSGISILAMPERGTLRASEYTKRIRGFKELTLYRVVWRFG